MPKRNSSLFQVLPLSWSFLPMDPIINKKSVSCSQTTSSNEDVEPILFNLSVWLQNLQVSHHPMIIAYHYEGVGWRLWGDSNLKSKFWGRSIQIDPVGFLTLEFDDGEVFQWSSVTTSIYNLILGKLYCEHYGTMRTQGNRDYSCKLKFKEQSIIDRTPHQSFHYRYGCKRHGRNQKWRTSADAR